MAAEGPLLGNYCFLQYNSYNPHKSRRLEGGVQVDVFLWKILESSQLCLISFSFIIHLHLLMSSRYISYLQHHQELMVDTACKDSLRGPSYIPRLLTNGRVASDNQTKKATDSTMFGAFAGKPNVINILSGVSIFCFT